MVKVARGLFTLSTDIMKGIKFLIDKNKELNMPLAINISLSTNDGAHNGSSLLEQYISTVSTLERVTIVIAAGNEGSGRTAYFKNLYKLKVNDEINIYYNNTKYIYKVNKNYEVDKNGIIDISRDKEQTTLVLTTCSKNKTKQVVILAYLVDKVSY